jgi:SAM-dependent methyltransferase
VKYDFAFSWDSTYGYAARLAGEHAEPGLVVDLGCGAAAFHQPLTELGFEYQGFEHDPESVELCRNRGIPCEQIDLAQFDRAVEHIVATVGDARVTVVSMLDVIEHLVDPDRVLAGLAALVDALKSDDHGPLLLVSIPNVAHFDLGAKLAVGRWDVTGVGLLDSTHVTLFTESRVVATMAGSGFAEVGRNDVRIGDSEQLFPVEHPALARAAPLSMYLRDLRDRADANGATYQFVRCYRRAEPTAMPPAIDDGPSPFCSVLVRATGGRDALVATLTGVGAQDDPDVEVIVALQSDELTIDEVTEWARRLVSASPERVTVFESSGPSMAAAYNEAFTRATGRYVTFLTSGQEVRPDWIAEFRTGSAEAVGRTVRSQSTRVITDDSIAPDVGVEPHPFSYVRQLADNDTPLGSFAAPRVAVAALGRLFDEQLGEAGDWEFMLQLTGRTGVVDRPAVTSTSPTRATLTDDEVAAVIARLDAGPLLLPPGSAGSIIALFRRASERDGFEQRVEAYERSRYWRITAPARWLSSRRRGPVQRG